MKKFALCVSLVGVLFLVGCSGTIQEGESTRVSNGYGEGDLTSVNVELQNGGQVECVVLIGYSKGGVSCDWANAK